MNPSILITPNSVEEGKLFSIIPTDGAGDLDVVRGTNATRVNENGLIETVGNNIARLDYTNGSCPSVLVEPQRTNLVFPSEIATTQSKTVTATTHTLSFYGTGTVTLSGVATASLVGTGVNNRVTFTFTPTAGVLLLTISGSVNKWQLEVGSNATSYIQTVGSAVTRNADVISKNGISDLIGQTEGTVYCEIKAISDDNVEKHITISDGTNSNRIDLFYGFYGAGKIYYEVRVAGSVQGGLLNGNLSVTSMNKIAIIYKTNRFELWINGIKASQDLIGGTFSGSTLSILQTSLPNGTNRFYGDINSIVLFKTALTDTQLTQLTSL